jgi:hypothetical protein
MNSDDAQTLRDISYFTGELLKHADVLPPDLVAMLRNYESELNDSPPGRWQDIGDPGQYDRLAQRIGQSITDGEWPKDRCLNSSVDNWYTWGEKLGNAEKALRLLAVRGDLVLRCGMYYTRSRDENS